jgi:hypothetical protein
MITQVVTTRYGDSEYQEGKRPDETSGLSDGHCAIPPDNTHYTYAVRDRFMKKDQLPVLVGQ